MSRLTVAGARGRVTGFPLLLRVTSAGTGDWHAGEDADPRTTELLRRHGYPIGHCARRVTDEQLAADLVVALDAGHDRMLAQLGVPAERRALLRSFDPDAEGGVCCGATAADNEKAAAAPSCC